jgi:hypothetical protein
LKKLVPFLFTGSDFPSAREIYGGPENGIIHLSHNSTFPLENKVGSLEMPCFLTIPFPPCGKELLCPLNFPFYNPFFPLARTGLLSSPSRLRTHDYSPCYMSV